MVARILSRVDEARYLAPHWNNGMIAASIGVSLLGAFTSTQLMCQARLSKYMSGVLLWSGLASLTFGFCSIFCLHFVAMLACELDLPINLSVPLTVLSAILAVSFTFAALACDLVWDRYSRNRLRRKRARRHGVHRTPSGNDTAQNTGPRPSMEGLLENGEIQETNNHSRPNLIHAASLRLINGHTNGHAISPARGSESPGVDPLLANTLKNPEITETLPTLADLQSKDPESESVHDEPTNTLSERDSTDALSEPLLSRRSSGVTDSDASTFGLGNMMSMRTYTRSSEFTKNAFVVVGRSLYYGVTMRNIVKALIWSLAIDSMHYIGIMALQIPEGYVVLNPVLVALSAIISWVVCLVGCILMAEMESRLAQQLLFSAVATAGVAAMHFTGMGATTFWSHRDSSGKRGYPPELAAAIATIAIVTCLAANFLLAHSATIARNKLAEIVQTRKKLWAAIAQKENAEAAARARSEFIASASHEIRTPLHQLQGYSDLLSRTELSEEGQKLLYHIQHATRSLSLITSNVLDWSRLEKGEATCRPVVSDIRLVSESIINLLPNREDEVQAELMVVVHPDVPRSLFIDETYVHRILMNLLSNALKFTSTGYVLLLIEMQDDKVVATVRDTGTGIPESFLPELFEPFKQAQTRGAQRGTGLGMSIIKQLLQKMGGTIEVTSKHKQADDDNGSVFVITIPTSVAPSTQTVSSPDKLSGKVGVLPGLHKKTVQGLRTAWSQFGLDLVEADTVKELPSDVKYVWATISFLKENEEARKALMKSPKRTVLVPMDSVDSLDQVTGLASAPNFLTLQRPLLWHRIVQSLENASRKGAKGFVDKAVRFAPETDVVNENGEPIEVEPTKTLTILLVEDNKINQKLGVKMLKTLGYDVLTADDGQDAIERMIEHDLVIDAVLMDQSMPRKDGLTATREIRAMEEDGTLHRRRPIIAVTAVVGPEAQSMCRDAGTDDFLPKPLSLAKLGQSLKHHLRSGV